VRLRLARAQWSAGKVADCLETAERLVSDESASEQASAAAGLAIHAALKLAAASREPAAQERLTKIADAVVRRWPQSVEADEARMALGKMALVKGDDERALQVFEGVNSASQRYPSALHWSAVVHWRRYSRVKGEPEDKRDGAAMSAERARAVSQLATSIKAQEATAVSGAPPRELMESQVLLAEIELEGGKPDEAAALVGPLVPVVRALPPNEQDAVSTRALLAALRAQILRKDLQHGDEAAVALIERGGNSPQAGAALLEFARLLRHEITQNGPNRETLVVTLTKILEHLGQRPQSSAAAMIFVAETLAELGRAEEARAEYQTILERADKDPQWLQVDRPLKTRVRAKLLSFLRSEGKYEQALAQADRLVQENPKAMEPRMERAQILQSWAETEPDRYAQAVAQWTELRTALQNVRPRPKEYYDVLYNAAWCLAAQSEHSGDKGLAHHAEQLLKSAIILSPSLDGLETVAKYNALLERCLGMQAERSKAKSNSNVKKG
jgi:tetratricopeptide (TPR) repeat protein